MPRIQRAILSCFDKTGIVELAQTLREYGVELVSTSGTLDVLRQAGVEALSISDFTGVAEMMDGRVKSLHPKVHAGLLGDRDNKLHVEQMQAYELQWVDLVVANLQPVEDLISRQGVTVREVLDQTDIGGCAMIRSAAKNFSYVSVVVNPKRYPTIVHEMRALEGEVSFATRYRLAQEAFYCTAEYDRAMADYLRRHEPPAE
ncbi:MAG: IMP cyclohydrolase [Candidatus Hydrogenedentes bacterium]|nr:IMP cyclohydrolase [Candidatus Hydrogenedentota bacterium]MBI3118589.1 IMP cyclohydrolase [Candidatus Hydrogenedentota bacterium]